MIRPMTTGAGQGPSPGQVARPVAAVFEFGREYIDAYDRSLDLAGGQLRNQPGRRFHVCFETDGGYMVVDVWESLEAFERFGEVLDEVVNELPGPVRVKLHRVHNLI
jgi:hypothetical protein